jgi:hypothetical protein
LWANTIAATGLGSAVGGALSGGFGGAAAGGGMLGKLGGAVGKFGIPGMILAGGAAASAAVYESGVGDDLGNWLFDKINGPTPKQATPGILPVQDVQTGPQLPVQAATTGAAAPAPAGAAPADRVGQETLAQQKKQTALLETIARGVTNTRPFVDANARAPR